MWLLMMVYSICCIRPLSANSSSSSSIVVGVVLVVVLLWSISISISLSLSLFDITFADPVRWRYGTESTNGSDRCYLSWKGAWGLRHDPKPNLTMNGMFGGDIYCFVHHLIVIDLGWWRWYDPPLTRLSLVFFCLYPCRHYLQLPYIHAASFSIRLSPFFSIHPAAAGIWVVLV